MLREVYARYNWRKVGSNKACRRFDDISVLAPPANDEESDDNCPGVFTNSESGAWTVDG